MMYPTGALGLLICLVLIANPHLFLRIWALAWGAVLWWATWRAGRLGLEVSATGIVRLGAFRTQRFAWDEVAGISTARVLASIQVFLDLTDGRRVLAGFGQGRTVVWQHGKTKDIVSVLQHEIDVRGALITNEAAPQASQTANSKISRLTLP
jgi:hypothetical protein